MHGRALASEVHDEHTTPQRHVAARTQHSRAHPGGRCVRSVIPDSRSDAIDWFTNRLAAWSADPAAIGLTEALVSELAAATAAVSNACTSAEQANDAKLAASQAYRNQADAMREIGVGLVQQIRGYAKATGDESVYSAALLPDPATPEPTPAPGTPYDFGISLLQDGSVELAFRCDSPGNVAGVTYDATVPAGTAVATYRVQARRSTQAGGPALFAVRFGVGGNGQATAEAA